jgi:N-acetylglucosaminyldiphosphoundecaprenol N-acetyl-beta-D-mannosaminyltransferase
VWVGLGAPKQELWASQHQHKISAFIVANGAAFAFHGGEVAQAPRLLQNMGLEWLFRLMMEPRRLWKRYLYNPLFVILVLLQVTGILKARKLQ